MTALYAFGSAALGTALSSRTFCLISRIIGAALIALAVFVFAAPAFAAGDQTLMAADGAQLTVEQRGSYSSTKVDITSKVSRTAANGTGQGGMTSHVVARRTGDCPPA